jgi:hypothetical protein
MAQNAISTAVLEEFQHDSQLMLNGSMSVDAAISRLDGVRVAGK